VRKNPLTVSNAVTDHKLTSHPSFKIRRKEEMPVEYSILWTKGTLTFPLIIATLNMICICVRDRDECLSYE